MFDENELINKLLRKTYENEISWHLETSPPKIISINMDNNIIACYKTYIEHAHLLLIRESYLDYSGEHDRFFNSERIRLIMLRENKYIIWENEKQTNSLWNLYDYVSSTYSGISDILKYLE